MSRRSLRPQLNQIRGWVRQGRTDAWIAHQLDVTVQQIQAFKREQGLEPDGEEPGAVVDEVDLRAEDDAQIAAELEAEAARRADEENGAVSYEEVDLRAEDDAAIAAELEAEEARREEERKAEEAKAAEEAARKAAEAEAEEPEAEAEPEEKPKRRTRARGGRTRKRVSTGPLEGTFDHGEEGYGLWLDPAVQDDPVYAEHWAGHRPIEVTIEEDQIVIRRSGSDDEDDDG